MRTKSTRKAALKKAERNFVAAARSLRGTAELAAGTGKVIAMRTQGPTDPAEMSRMVMEKITASYAVGMALVGTMMTFAPAVARRMLTARVQMGPFALWEAMAATSFDVASLMLKGQSAMMAPLSAAVHSNVVRLEKRA